MNVIFVALLLILGPIVSAQNLQEGQKRWSTESPLTIDDFQIKISDENNDPVYSQFVISHAISGFDFLKKNLNQKIENVFYGNASWIDTSMVENTQKQVEFQQLQFDLAEVHTRQFRKRVLENKGQIAKGFGIINQISDEIMRELSESRLQLVKETKSGLNEEKLAEWREKIANDLKELEDFSYDNKKAVKLSN
ncbi:hypothetical protein LZ575_10450 [Antarcticibacterium sp. 1MA-6-2]|uniref:hypothetical protein n=1 Tax=Antarcticibacterium sp. 1MA-6-2 TaxID=2908210 RepID=UPI001F27EE6F|nr:hypothetical protein [Antarcticibacterium sp. 1MA-6-2]UJH92800.1 hypothetical protein LZ575_10450 [Antarcticibacterium sp. 1MA-6-2]